tara:strand:- start:50381 stop:50692 length:312 start_codon:yes stop_codon:yes gene_type:complete
MTDQTLPEGMVSLKTKLNLETAKAPWRELQTFFAQGLVLNIQKDLDLLTVAEQFAADNKALFEEWLSSGQVVQVSDELAMKWYENDTSVWTLVIKPWILVQAE